jgi:peptide/nickel transport system permease protein
MHNRSALLGLVLLLLVVIGALFSPVIAPYDPKAQALERRLTPPAFAGGSREHLLGTDQLGRDLFSRIVYGARVSLLVGLTAVLLAGLSGITLGILSGMLGGFVDKSIMRLADIQLALPFILFALAVMAVLGPGLRNVILVLGITGWVVYGRVVRSETLSLREKEFVEASRALGHGHFKIIRRHILPNIMPTAIVLATLQVANMIIAEASLSFLGLGIEPDIPSWGSMLADGRGYISTAWWVATFPGLAIMFTVLSINLIGDWLRDSLDPRLKSTI